MIVKRRLVAATSGTAVPRTSWFPRRYSDSFRVVEYTSAKSSSTAATRIELNGMPD
jgi:hypothetical protein